MAVAQSPGAGRRASSISDDKAEGPVERGRFQFTAANLKPQIDWGLRGTLVDVEEQQAVQILHINAEAAPSSLGQARRAQHSKHHGCVTAIFEVRGDAPIDLHEGLFACVGRYPAYIRFSNGRQQDDRRPDAHGMAIKLLGVPGEKLLPGETHQSAQDFVLVDSEVFFTGDGADYAWLNKGLLEPGQSLLRRAWFALSLLWRFPLLIRILRFTGRRPTSPLTQSYYSTTPYALGNSAVKWVVRPSSTRDASPLSTVDGLAEALRRDLADAPFHFDFGVDVQVDLVAQPIEDPTIRWSGIPGARRVWLATIEIPPQAIDAGAPLAEDITFSPWHGLVAHTPLGLINRLRKPVYRQLAIRRHELNGVVPADTSELPDEPAPIGVVGP